MEARWMNVCRAFLFVWETFVYLWGVLVSHQMVPFAQTI